jgi:hypothetical protein
MTRWLEVVAVWSTVEAEDSLLVLQFKPASGSNEVPADGLVQDDAGCPRY